jgi:hypothetical protein
LINPEENRTIKIEVKTRQSIYSTATSERTKNLRQFQITQNECDEMDLLICFWFDYNAFFIVPKSYFVKNNKLKITIRKGQNGDFGSNQEFLDNWEQLERLMVGAR